MAFEKTLAALAKIGNSTKPSSALDIRRVLSNTAGVETSRSVTLSDYVWYPFYTAAKRNDAYPKLAEGINVPKLTAFEFQPATDLTMYIRLLVRAVKAAQAIRSGDSEIGEVLSRIAGMLDTDISAGIGGVLSASNADDIILNFKRANQYYIQISDGKYVKRFEFPTYNDEIWSANGGSGWEAMGALEKYVGFAASSIGGYGLDVPAKPKFTASKVQTASVSTKFYLFNANLACALANLKFLYSFLPGGYWTQDSYYQRGSNLYTVRFENYYQYQLCAMEATVSMKGKSRRPPKGVSSKYKSITMLPDIFEVDIKFTNLLPNTLNQFLAPYFQEFTQNVGIGKSVTGLVPLDYSSALDSPAPPAPSPQLPPGPVPPTI